MATNTPNRFVAIHLPIGLTLNPSTGVITGAASIAGTYPIILGATHANGVYGTAHLLLTILGSSSSPSSTTAPPSSPRRTAFTGQATPVAGTIYNAFTLAGIPTVQGDVDASGPSATFDNPSGTAIDSSGNIYVADTGNCSIRKISPAGVVSTLAGPVNSPPGQAYSGSTDGTGTSARFNFPEGVAVDSAGNVYVADTRNCTIRKITPSGVVSTLAGTAGVVGSADGTGSAAQFKATNALAVDSVGNVYVADTYNQLIRKVTPSGVVTTLAGTVGYASFQDGTGTGASFSYPEAVTVDTAGNVYVADQGNCLIREISPSAVVTTLAGQLRVYGSQDGTGSAAEFRQPFGITVDSSGTVFVADTYNYTIREITPAGVVTTLAGSPLVPAISDGAGNLARFFFPLGIAVDANNNLYVGDNGNDTVRTIRPPAQVAPTVTSGGSASGQQGSAFSFSVLATNYPTNYSAAGLPAGLSIDAVEGTITGVPTVAGTFSVSLTVTNAAGSASANLTVTLSLTSPRISGATRGTTVNSPFSYAISAVYSPTGYTASPLPAGLTFNSTTGVISGTPTTTGTTAIAISASNAQGMATATLNLTVYPAGSLANSYYYFSIAGVAGTTGAINGPGNFARLNDPSGIAIDSSGNVYVADFENNAIRKISPSGIVSTLAGLTNSLSGQSSKGTADGTGSSARFNGPDAIALDSNNNLYVTDFYNSSIRKITPAGVVNTLAGLPEQDGFSNGTGYGARFAYPEGIAVDSSGNVYVADDENHMIRKVTAAGVVTTLAGSGTAGYRDGTGTSASFNYPGGLAIDSAGNIYVADTGNSVIRKVTPMGVVTTLAGIPNTYVSLDGPLSTAQFQSPERIALDAAGNLYVADGSSVRKITPQGVVITIGGQTNTSGNTDGLGAVALFNGPSGIALDVTGNLYLGDSGNDTVRVGMPSSQAAPAINSSATASSSVSGPFNYTIAGSNTPTLFTATGLPSGLSLNSSTGAITGSVAAAGTYPISITATNSSGTGTSTLTLNIFATPVLTTSGSGQTASAGQFAASPLVVTVKNGSTPVAGATVVFTVTQNSGLLATTTTGTPTLSNSVSVTSNSSGQAQIYFQEPKFAGAISTIQAAVSGTNASFSSSVPLTPTPQISDGQGYMLAVKSDGTLWGWGDNSGGELGLGTLLNQPTATTIPGPTGVVAVAASRTRTHSLAVDSLGLLWAWGDNVSNDLGLGQTTPVTVNVPTKVPGIAGLVAVSGGSAHSVALKNDGTVWTWGSNSAGQLGQGLPTSTTVTTPQAVTGVSNIIAIASGYNHTLALKSDGTVLAWGDNSNGELGRGNTASSTSPVSVQLPGGVIITAITAGNNWSMALSSTGTVYVWGSNGNSQLGDGTTVQQTLPETVNGITDTPMGIAAGTNHALVLCTQGTVWGWGDNSNGEVPVSSNSPTVASPVALSGLTSIIAISAGGQSSATIRSDGSILLFGNDSLAQIGDGLGILRTSPVQISSISGIKTLYGGYRHALALKTDGTPWGWGDNNGGDLADPTLAFHATPIAISGLSGAITTLLAGHTHSLAIKGDGSLWSWGNGTSDQEGNGTVVNQPTPTQILTGVTAAAIGYSHCLAVKTGGTLWSWGVNSSSQLGLGTVTANQTSPQPVTIAGVVSAVSAGQSHSVALMSDGTVQAWGLNGSGQVGNNSKVTQTTPTAVSNLSSIQTVVSGANFNLALKTDHTVWAWGDNSYGQLGLGNTTNQLVPVQIPTLTNIIQISAGLGHAVALSSTGTVYAWGQNTSGQVGNGSLINASTPTAVAGLSGVSQIAASGFCTMALKSDGTLCGWGDGSNGNLAIGVIFWHPVPSLVNGLNLLASSPILSLTSPATGSKELINVPIALTAATADTGGSVSQVTYYNEGIAIGTATSSPFGLSWTPSTLGTFNISAVATDSRGFNSLRSPYISVIVAQPTAPVSTPSFSLAPGTYTSYQTVTLTSTPGSTIYYTTDGSTPTPLSFNSVASGATITVAVGETVRAIATKPGYIPSAVASAAYVIQIAATPTLSPAAGTYTSAQSVTVTSNPGSTIYYTLDGSIPTTSSTSVATGRTIAVNGSETINLIATEAGYGQSAEVNAAYVIQTANAAAPVISAPLTTLAVFTGPNGTSPEFGPLVQGNDGNFYGTTLSGSGSAVDGTVFKVTPSGALTTLGLFTGANGNGPFYGLVEGRDGNFYGTTTSGGSNGHGTVFQITQSGSITTIYSFPNAPNANPGSGLISGSDGNLYGTTSGNSGNGTVYKITPTGVLTTLCTFTGTLGTFPNSVMQGNDGNFYGTTGAGAANGHGGVFMMTPSGTLSLLCSFTAATGSVASAPLIQGTDRNFYGTTYNGGNSNVGSVYKVTPAGVLTTLYSFTGTKSYPYGGLIQDNNGNFYGTTSQGGPSGLGTVFELTPSGTLSTLLSFAGTNGLEPFAGLTWGTDGYLYGQTLGGGPGGNGEGTVFKLTPPNLSLVAENFFSYQISASNSPTSYGASGLPSTLSVNSKTGLISGTPTAAGTYNVTISATNASGTSTAMLTLTVTPTAISSATSATGTTGEGFSYQITATNGPTIYGVIGALPTGVTLNSTTGLISGTPVIPGTYNVTVSATTSSGSTSSASLAIDVLPSPPEEWSDGDIGAVGTAGSGTYSSSTSSFTVNGAGSGVGGQLDSCNLVSEPVSGNVEIIAHVGFLQNTGNNATAGLMMRNSSAPNAVSAYVAVTPANGVEFITRTALGATSTTALGGLGAPLTAPIWLRLVRSSTSQLINGVEQTGYFALEGYYSTDGVSWTVIGTQNIQTGAASNQMSNNILMGMAVSSTTGSQAATASFDHVDAMTNVPQRSANLVSWYRSDVGVTLNGSTVSQWNDQSGNGNNALQSTPGNQPALISNVINGQSAVRFNSSDITSLTSPYAAGLNSNQLTIIAVTRKTSSSASGTIVSRYNGSTYPYRLAIGTANTPGIYTNTNAASATGILSNGTFGVLEGDYDQTSVRMYVNGTLTGSSPYTAALVSSTGPLQIGAEAGINALDGDIAELLIYNNGLTTQQRQQVEAYLYQKYGVGTLPVASSPTLSAPPGIYNSQTLTLTPGLAGDTLYYTTDGTIPTTGSAVYTGPIVLPSPSTTTLNVIEASEGFINSPVLSAIYTIDPTCNFTHTGLVAWFRADAGVTPNGSAVSQWNDQSGNGNNAVQKTMSFQPTLSPGALNGKTVLHFSQANSDYLSVADASTLDLSNFTMIVVGRFTTNGADNLVEKLYSYGLGFGNTLQQPVVMVNGQAPVVGSISANTWTMLEGKYDQVKASLYVNGTLTQAACTVAIPQLGFPLYIGGLNTAGSTVDGDIAEVLIFNTALSDADRKSVEAYLYARYGVGVQPTAPTPAFSTPSTSIYSSYPTVVLNPGQSGEKIYYTTDGSTPTTSSTAYTAPFKVTTSTETVNAIAALNGYMTSGVVSANYKVDSQTAFTRNGLVAWYRADTGTMLNGSTIQKWQDLSGSGNDVTQASNTLQPTLTNNAPRGLSELHFALGTYNQALSVANNPSLNPSQITIFTVARVPSTGSSTEVDGLVGKWTSGSPDGYSMRLNGYYANGNSNPVFGINGTYTSGGVLSPNVWSVLEGKYDQASASMYINGVLTQAAVTSPITASAQPMIIGGWAGSGSPGDLDVAEVLIFNTALSDADRGTVEAYLYARYGVGVQPMAVAPTLSATTGIYNGSQTISLQANQSGESIYYTTDGTFPTTNSTPYSGPITVSSTSTPTTIKAIATLSGYLTSGIVSATYTIDPGSSFTRAGLVAWYRADAGTVPNGSTIQTWRDQSGQGNDVTQMTGSMQPSIASATLNGRAVMHFTHANSSCFAAADSPPLDPSQTTIFTVARNTGTSAGYLVDKRNGISGYSMRFATNNTTPTFYINNSTVAGALTANTWGLMEGKYDQSWLSLYVNGTLTQASLVGAITNYPGQPLNIGGISSGGNTPDSDIAEVLIFNSALSDADRSTVEAYLYARYGVGVQPTAPAPTFAGSNATISTTGQSVVLNAGLSGETVYYTTDGSTPTTSSTVYTGQIAVNSTETIKAIGAINGFISSGVVSSTYTIDGTANFARTGLVGWYRADTGLTVIGGVASQWNDQSGNGNNALQLNAAQRPAVGPTLPNGRPALYFATLHSNYMSVSGASALNPSQVTVIAVADVMVLGSSSVQTVVGQFSGANYSYNLGFSVSASNPELLLNSGAATAAGTLGAGTYGVLEGKYDTTAHLASFYVNGVLSGSTNYNTPLTSNSGPVTIGGSSSGNYLFGNIAEVMIFNTALSDTQRHQVEAYLYQRYGLGTQPPSPTPTLSSGTNISSSPENITVTPAVSGDAIYYTTDGSPPTTSSNSYAGSIPISATAVLKVIEVEPGYAASPVVSANYTIDPTTTFTRTGLSAWYRADVGTGLSGAGPYPSSISSWPDQSGQGNDLAQSVSTMYPGGTMNVINGHPVLHFSHAQNSFLSAASNAPLTPSQVTTFTVARNMGSTGGVLVDKFSGGAGYSLRFTTNNTTPSAYINNSSATGTLAAGAWGVVESKYDQSNLSLFVNGALTQTALTSPITTSNQVLSVGGLSVAGNTPDSDIAEVLVFSSALSDQDRLTVENYLAQRYGLLVPILASPQFSVPGGTLNAPQQIAINAPAGSTLYFTTDGSTPATSSSVYSGPIFVDYSETIKAVAYENGFPTSSIITANFSLNPSLWPGPVTGNSLPPTITLQLPTNATLLP